MQHRFLVLLPLATLIIFFTVYASSKDATSHQEETKYQAALRLIGHKLLLSAGDIRSRVLPIKELKRDQFQIHFEHPLSIEPDSLFNIISQTTKLSLLPNDYTVEVFTSPGEEVVYSIVNSSIDSNTIVPCLGRSLPKGRYFVTISFTSSGPAVSNWLAGFALLLFSTYLITFYFKRQKNKVVNLKDQAPVIKNGLQIGEFLFYADQRYLSIKDEKIELTDKETKLLHILASAPNIVIDREKFQKEVWENEGVIVTRSLDVFISRLRKKLEKDGSIRLINVHGKGYKLELTA